MNFSKKNHENNQSNLKIVNKKVLGAMLALILFTSVSFAQNIDFGIKGGVNYNFGGDLSEIITVSENSVENILAGADGKAGFHVAFWTKVDILGLYLRPELVYTQLNNSYSNSGVNVNTDFKTTKIDIPILIGAKIAGPLHIFAGPSFQYITKSTFSQNDFINIEKQDFTAGLQIGFGVEFGNLGIDARWEKGFNNDVDGEFTTTQIKVDNRPNQVIFGLSYRFNERD